MENTNRYLLTVVWGDDHMTIEPADCLSSAFSALAIYTADTMFPADKVVSAIITDRETSTIVMEYNED